MRLSRQPHKAPKGPVLLDRLPLAEARVHEAHGPAREVFAFFLARALAGPVFWIAPSWDGGRLHAPGMLRFGLDPGRVTFIHAAQPRDLLWTLEEVLRAGCVPLVIGDLSAPPALTPMRRMQLAAETGAREGGVAPVGLILTPEGTAPGSESRWHIAPDHRPETLEDGAEAWRLRRERARSAAPRDWRITPHGEGFSLADLPSQPG